MNYNQAIKILNLKSGTDKQELKQAFRKHALASHPDKGGNETLFIEIKEAYDFLCEYEDEEYEYEYNYEMKCNYNVEIVEKAIHEYKQAMADKAAKKAARKSCQKTK